MLHLVAKLKAVPGKEIFLAEECVKMAEKVRLNEKGCVLYAPYVSLEDSTEIVFIEQYTDQEALDYHRKTTYMKEFKDKITTVLAEPLDVKILVEETV